MKTRIAQFPALHPLLAVDLPGGQLVPVPLQPQMDPARHREPGSSRRIRRQRWISGAFADEDKDDVKFIIVNHNDDDFDDQVRCDSDRPILEVALQDTECRPYILPLFPDTAEVMMGRNLTWLCKMVSSTIFLILVTMVVQVGSSKGKLTWSLPHGQILSEGDCWTDRACVKVHHHDCDDDCDDHDDDDAKPQWLHLSFQMSPQSECFRGCIVRLVAFIETFHHLSAVEKSHHAKSQ